MESPRRNKGIDQIYRVPLQGLKREDVAVCGQRIALGQLERTPQGIQPARARNNIGFVQGQGVGNQPDGHNHGGDIVQILQLVEQVQAGKGRRVKAGLGNRSPPAQEAPGVHRHVVVVLLASPFDQLVGNLDQPCCIVVVRSIVVIIPAGNHKFGWMFDPQLPASPQEVVRRLVGSCVDPVLGVMGRTRQRDHRFGRIRKSRGQILPDKGGRHLARTLALAHQGAVVRPQRVKPRCRLRGSFDQRGIARNVKRIGHIGLPIRKPPRGAQARQPRVLQVRKAKTVEERRKLHLVKPAPERSGIPVQRIGRREFDHAQRFVLVEKGLLRLIRIVDKRFVEVDGIHRVQRGPAGNARKGHRRPYVELHGHRPSRRRSGQPEGQQA